MLVKQHLQHMLACRQLRHMMQQLGLSEVTQLYATSLWQKVRLRLQLLSGEQALHLSCGCPTIHTRLNNTLTLWQLALQHMLCSLCTDNLIEGPGCCAVPYSHCLHAIVHYTFPSRASLLFRFSQQRMMNINFAIHSYPGGLCWVS